MKTRLFSLAALIALAGCGNDEPTTPSGPSVPNVAGYYESDAMWFFQFRRLHDNYSGSFTCAGTLSLQQPSGQVEPGKASLTGFAFVSRPCPEMTFAVKGTALADGSVTLVSDGPRPPEGQCPSPYQVSYTGVWASGTLSARTSTRIWCPGPGEGYHDFTYLITARKTF